MSGLDWQQVFARSPNPYMVLDRDLRFVEMNDAYLAVVGCARADLVGVGVFDAFPGDGSPAGNEAVCRLRRSLRRALDEGETDVIELIRYAIPVETADGTVIEERYWTATNTPLRNADGEVTHVLQNTMDVTELQFLKQELESARAPSLLTREKMEGSVFGRARRMHDTNVELERQRTELLKLFDQAPGFMAYLHGPDHVYTLFNREYRRLVGPRLFVGRRVADVVPEIAVQGYLQLLDRVYTTGEPFVGRGMRLALESAPGEFTDVVLDFVYQPVRDVDGRVTGILVQGNDITEQAAAQAELARYHAGLAELVEERTRALEASEQERRAAESALLQAQKLEAIGQLTGGIAHDFNNLLQVISANLSLLQAVPGLPPAAAERAQSASTAVRRGARLASQLLTFARRHPLRTEVFDAGAQLLGLREILERSLAEVAGIALAWNVGEGPFCVDADAHQFDNAVLNLAINARDAMPAGGTVAIDCAVVDGAALGREHERYVRIRVRDEGVGMAPDVLARIYEPFFTTKAVGKGSGLGLPMVYGFVQQSGGHIEVDSTPGAGTTVSVFLPESRKAVVAAVDDRRPVLRGHGERILVVEDDAQVAAASVGLLESLGYAVVQAPDAGAAWSMIESGLAPDLLFTDVVMPGRMRAPDLVRLARERLPGLAVLYTSGYAGDLLARTGALDEAVEIIDKPFDADELARRVHALLAERGGATHTSGDAGTDTGRLRILYVDDSPDERYLMEEMLSLLGHCYESVGDPDVAYARITGGHWDVLLTDVELPKYSGIELVERLRAEGCAPRVVYVSGHDRDVLHERGAAGTVLTKPFDLEQLRQALAPR